MSAPQHSSRSFRHAFEGPFFRRLLLGGLRHVPQSIQRATLPVWASTFYSVLPTARHAAQENIARILYGTPIGELSLTSRAVVFARAYRLFECYAQTLTYLYRMHMGLPHPLEVEFRGIERVHEVIEKGHGAVTVTGHLGPWQLMPFIMQSRQDRDGMPPMTMAMAEEPNARLSEFEERFREKFNIVYTTRSPFALLELAKVLARREIVGMQLDRHPGGGHVVCQFFGMPVPFPVGPAVLARISGSPIIPLFAVYTNAARTRVAVHYEEPIYVEKTRDKQADFELAMARVVEVYEAHVRRHADQWFNFFDFFAPATEAQRQSSTRH